MRFRRRPASRPFCRPSHRLVASPSRTRTTGTLGQRLGGVAPTSTRPSARATAQARSVRMNTPSARAWPPTFRADSVAIGSRMAEISR